MEPLYLALKKMYLLFLIYQVLFKITSFRIQMVVTPRIRMPISGVRSTVSQEQMVGSGVLAQRMVASVETSQRKD